MNPCDATKLLDELVEDVEDFDAADLRTANHRIDCHDGRIDRLKKLLGISPGREADLELQVVLPIGDGVPRSEGTEADDDAQQTLADGGLVQCCPNCDSTRFFSRVGNDVDRPPRSTKNYYCANCDADFDEPDLREPRSSTDGLNGLAATLDELEPDDLPPGGKEVRS